LINKNPDPVIEGCKPDYSDMLRNPGRLITLVGCAKGGVCEWGTDGAHSNEFCKKCFRDKPAGIE